MGSSTSSAAKADPAPASALTSVSGDDAGRAVTISAGGKVLLTGGYLILDRAHRGLVLCMSARFHTTVRLEVPWQCCNRLAYQQGRWDPITHGGSQLTQCGIPSAPGDVLIMVHCPQRCDTPQLYVLRCYPLDDRMAQLHCLSTEEDNRFVEYSLRYVLSFLHWTLGSGKFHARLNNKQRNGRQTGVSAIRIDLRGDQEFYSTGAQLQEFKHVEQESSQTAALSSFFNASKPQDKTPAAPSSKATEDMVTSKKDSKTGLGSSAALVSSLVAALFAFFDWLPDDTTMSHQDRFPKTSSSASEPQTSPTANQLYCGLSRYHRFVVAHNFAQFCHCAAQGKVGSGFDVSSAFYGTHVYRRFSPSLLAPLLNRVGAQQHNQDQYPGDSKVVRSCAAPICARGCCLDFDALNVVRLVNGLGFTVSRQPGSGKPASFAPSDSGSNASKASSSGSSASESKQDTTTASTTTTTSNTKSGEDGDLSSDQQSLGWDTEACWFQLPRQFCVALGDVQGGSKTPGMVRKVLGWRKERAEEAGELWGFLDQQNRRVELVLRVLQFLERTQPLPFFRAVKRVEASSHQEWSKETQKLENGPQLVQMAIRAFHTHTADGEGKDVVGSTSQAGAGLDPDITEDAVVALCAEVASLCTSVRGHLQRMGQLAGDVPIEPGAQTALLDATLRRPGVLFACVPGAGGFDAVVAVVVSQTAARELKEWWLRERKVHALNVESSCSGICVQQGTYVPSSGDRGATVVFKQRTMTL